MSINKYINEVKDGFFDLFVIEDENRVYATPITVVKGSMIVSAYLVFVGLIVYGMVLALQSIITGDFNVLFTTTSEEVFTSESENLTLLESISMLALALGYVTWILLIVLILDKIWRFLNNLVIFEKYN
jgi:hypothetical protein